MESTFSPVTAWMAFLERPVRPTLMTVMESSAENGGTCHDVLSSYTCECTCGFSGRNCGKQGERHVKYFITSNVNKM